VTVQNIGLCRREKKRPKDKEGKKQVNQNTAIRSCFLVVGSTQAAADLGRQTPYHI